MELPKQLTSLSTLKKWIQGQTFDARSFIQPGTITEDKLVDGAITSAKIADGTVVTADLANGSVTDAKLSNHDGAARVTSLPGSPYDGQEITYVADATDRILWRFKYNASGGSYKWEYIGGTPLERKTTSITSVSTAATHTTYQTLGAGATADPSITVPFAGDYVVTIGHEAQPPATAGEGAVTSYKIGATAPDDLDRILAYTPAAGLLIVTGERVKQKQGLTASQVLQMQHKSSTGPAAATFYARWMSVIPIRVG